jgi:DNA-binding SARP family transcriptional activator
MDMDERRPARGRRRLTLLERFRLMSDDVEVPVTVRGRRLVALVALRGPVPRSLAGGLLWPEVPEERARGSVRAAVCGLQRTVPHLLQATGYDLRLAPGVEVDVTWLRDVTRAALRLQPGDPVDPAALELAPGGRLAGDLLPGWYDDWVVVESEQLHQLRLHALDVLVQRLVEAGRYPVAIELAMAAVAADPLRESAHRTLMQVHLAEGNAAEALRQFERFRQTLRAAMGLEPGRRMLDLVRQIRAMDAGEAAAARGGRMAAVLPLAVGQS